MSVEMTEQTKIDTLEFFLLVGRLPDGAHEYFIGQTGLPREFSMMCCLLYAGMGVVWPIPCLARKMDGGWFEVSGAGPDDGTVWKQ